MDVMEQYHHYNDNVSKINELDSIVKTNANCEAWIKSMEERAINLHEAYSDNNKILSDIYDYCNSDLSDDEINDLYGALNKLFIMSADSEFLLILIRRLIDEYEPINDYPKLINLYLMGFMVLTQNDDYTSDDDEARVYLKKIIDMTPFYPNLDEVSQRKMYIAYHGLAASYIENNKDSAEKSFIYYKKLVEFNENNLKINDKLDSEWKNEYLRFASIDWLSISKAYYDLSDLAKKEVYILANRLYYEEFRRCYSNEYDIMPQIYGSYLNVMAGTGELSYEDVADRLFDYYKFNIARIDECKDKDNIILNVPIELLGHLKHLADRPKAIRIFNELDIYVQKTWKKYFTSKTSHYVNNLFSCWVTNALFFIDDKERQEKYIFNLLSQKEIPIYLHSVMVKNIAEIIFLATYSQRPDLFLGIDEEDMPQYINNAALIHDIGKTRISTTINQHDRRLSSREFMGIRKHPSYGAELIADHKGLTKYTDIILYHHKYYDGKGGYPEDDGNVKSKYRIVIDIVTIADSLEAATDSLDRNYRNSKTADDVFKEFDEYKGTKYNPDIVNIILSNEKLKGVLRNITGNYRNEIMYKAYRDGIGEL